MKSEEDSLCLAGKGEGEEALELEGLEEDSMKVTGGGDLKSQDGEEECDLGDGVEEFDKTGDLPVAMQGDEASFGDTMTALEDGRTGDSL